MFHISVLSDVLQIHPASFGLARAQALSAAVHAKYSNRVLIGEGLAVALWDFLDVEEGRVRGGEGGLWFRATFRLVVFRPFAGEVLVGKIMGSDEVGIRVSLGFFDDIYIPSHLMPTPSAFDHAEQAWFWLFEASPEVAADPLLSSPDVRMYLDAGELIRLAVEDDIFEEPEPGPVQSAAVGGPGPPGANASIVTEGDETKKTSPYRITGSIASQGMGLVSWWQGTEPVQGLEEEAYAMEEDE